MRQFIPLLLGVLLSAAASGQESLKSRLEGNWYSPGRNGFLRMQIRNDSLLSERVNTDMVSQGRLTPRMHIQKITEKDKNIYLFTRPDSAGKIRITTLTNFLEDKQFDVAINGINKSFKSLAEAEAILPKDNFEKFGYTWYSEKEVERLKKLKALGSMKKDEFISFIKEYLPSKRSAIKAAEAKFGTAGASIAESQALSRILIKNGYNPMLPAGELEKLFEKYQDDQEVKPLLEKLSQE
jgi:hypothetical protein